MLLECFTSAPTSHLAACIVAEHLCPLLAFLLGELHQETHPRDHQTDIKLPLEQACAESAIDPCEAKESVQTHLTLLEGSQPFGGASSEKFVGIC